jgi:hypothetical protein
MCVRVYVCASVYVCMCVRVYVCESVYVIPQVCDFCLGSEGLLIVELILQKRKNGVKVRKKYEKW